MAIHDTTIQLDPVPDKQIERQQILIIDDDREQTETLAFALRRQGFDVVTAHSVQAGSAAVELYRPQLMIMDIRLPDGNGLDLCERMGDDATTCQIPVIILSAMEGPNLVRRARSAGCHFFLRKPYDPNALLLLAENALSP